MKEFIEKYVFKFGWIIAVLNLLAIINSTWFFLGMAKFPVTAWIFFNACAPSVMIFLVGFFTKEKGIMAAALPFLFFFGGLGLFVFGWKGTAIISQIGHILMVCAIIYTIIVISIEKLWKRAAIGFIIGLVFFAVFLPFQQRYVKSHPEYIQKLGDPAFEEFMNNKNK